MCLYDLCLFFNIRLPPRSSRTYTLCPDTTLFPSAAIFDIFLAPERHGAGAAVAGLDEDLGLIEKMHRRPLGGRRGFGQRSSPLRRQGPLSVYAARLNKAAGDPRLCGGDG